MRLLYNSRKPSVNKNIYFEFHVNFKKKIPLNPSLSLLMSRSYGKLEAVLFNFFPLISLAIDRKILEDSSSSLAKAIIVLKRNWFLNQKEASLCSLLFWIVYYRYSENKTTPPQNLVNSTLDHLFSFRIDPSMVH